MTCITRKKRRAPEEENLTRLRFLVFASSNCCPAFIAKIPSSCLRYVPLDIQDDPAGYVKDFYDQVHSKWRLTLCNTCLTIYEICFVNIYIYIYIHTYIYNIIYIYIYIATLVAFLLIL